MPVKPMLGDLELDLVQQVEVDEHQVRAQHAVPALEGDFLQELKRRAARFTLMGVLANEDVDVGDELKKLREKFRAAEPVPFATDIATATRIDTVLIEEMSVRELAGKPQRFEYAFTLREFIPAPEPEVEPPPPPPPPPQTSLIVEVIVEGQPGFDFSTVQVTVRGTQEDGTSLDRPLTNRQNNIWTEEDFPPGNYTVRAVAPDPVVPGTVMANEVGAEVLEGAKKKVTIVLTPGQRRNVATALVVHYWFDKAFIEPCLRPVLREAAQRASSGSEKILIVGHTDLVGGDDYNQALSERRSRGVHAYLTFGNDPDAAVAEWNELRKTRTIGQTTSLNDTWGVREYQYILQDLGFYVGPINETHDGNTDAAVRAFQTAKGLTVDGVVGDDTWPALIRDYLAQDSLSIDPARFLRNAKDGCDGGPILWLGCGEKDPLNNTPDAWRPNRRTEMLFVVADEIPCPVPQPVTWAIRPDGSATPSWCLGPGDRNKPCCFLSRSAEQSDQWLVQPAHPEKVCVSGEIVFDDGTPFANQCYSLIAPDGEFLHKNSQGNEDRGEVASGAQRGRPIFGRTDDQGRFSHPVEKPVGVYILELPDLQAPAVARLAEDPPHTARGNVVCVEYQSSGGVSEVSHQIIISPSPVPAPPVNPSITPATSVLAVRKPHTNPPRQAITLNASASFTGTGTLTRSGNTAAVRLFTAASNGTEITFNGTDNVFTGVQLASGVTLFAEAASRSNAVDDYQLSLALTAGTQPVGPAATAAMTAVEFTLDIALSRPAPGAEPAVLSEADKINVGRTVQVRDPSFSHERAMLIVRQPNPAVAVNLVLTPLNGRLQAFNEEQPADGQTPLPVPDTIPSAGIPANGARFFLEGAAPSPAVRDTGYRLGVDGLAQEVDRVVVTTAQLEVTSQDTAASPALTFVRFGLWDQAYDAAGEIKTGADEVNHFIGRDARKFHFRAHDPSQAGHMDANWRTLQNDRVTNEDAPASQVLTLVETPPGSGVFFSRSVILVTNNVDKNQPTQSGLAAPLDTGARAAGQSNHRLRRARLDGFMRVEYAPQAGVLLGLTLPVFDRALRFTTNDSTDNIAAGARTLTPARMSGTVNGVPFSIKVGSNLVIDTGANQETVTVTAVTATTFTANFTKAHNGTAAPFQIVGFADERRRASVRVIRYTNAADPTYHAATDAYIRDQFVHANEHWNQIGLQLDPQATVDRVIPAAALDAGGRYPFVPPLGNSPQQTAVLADLIPITPDNTLTVVFAHMSGPANAYALIVPIVPSPIPLPAGGTVTMDNRFFIICNTNLNLNNETVAHELHHTLFNRFDTATDGRFYTLNTNAPTGLAAAHVPPIVLPDSRIYYRIQNRNSADPNNDPNNDNIINWARRRRTARFPQPFGFAAADATTGNTLTTDF